MVNDEALTQFTRKAVEELYPGQALIGQQYIWYAAETFSMYSQLAPTVFVFAGIKNDDLSSRAKHHNDRIDLDEDALQYAVEAIV